MSIQRHGLLEEVIYGKIFIVRSFPALILGLLVTFMQNESTQVGLIIFSTFTLSSTAFLLPFSRQLMSGNYSHRLMILYLLFPAIFGIIALTGLALGDTFFAHLLIFYAVLMGALELYCALRTRGKPLAKDWVALGVMNIILASVIFLVPSDPLTLVGLCGVYFVILGVYLLIAGLSLTAKNRAEPHSLQIGGTVR